MKFQELLGYKKSLDLAMDILEVSKKFPKEEKYFVLNSTGAEFWKLLVKGEVSLEEAVDYFLTLYDCDKEVIKKDLLELVENLEKHGLVEVK